MFLQLLEKIKRDTNPLEMSWSSFSCSVPSVHICAICVTGCLVSDFGFSSYKLKFNMEGFYISGLKGFKKLVDA